ncbi:hypothetical protein, partial [Pseudomonas capeferrum]|uniref:hypothetical protein n=1 Tax=Pseudomonas capeferrum TaxID=1495066 RepID=UPI0030D83371
AMQIAPVVVTSPSTAWPLPPRLTRIGKYLVQKVRYRNLTAAKGLLVPERENQTLPTPNTYLFSQLIRSQHAR